MNDAVTVASSAKTCPFKEKKCLELDQTERGDLFQRDPEEISFKKNSKNVYLIKKNKS